MIEDTFLKLKSNLELTPTFREAVSRQQNAVRSVIENNGLAVTDTKLIGSVARQTRIQPRPGDDFDIDILVELGAFDRWVPTGGITTQVAMDHVYGAVKDSDRYAKMNPELDHPTITFTYGNGVKVELVPAYLDNIGAAIDGSAHEPKGRGYWVPAGHGRWELADYFYERDVISDANQRSHGWLIPTVKMLKAVKREHFPGLKSYHLEVIAVDRVPKLLQVCAANQWPVSYPYLVAAFLYELPDHIGKSWRIPGSLSPPFVVDLYLQLSIGDKLAWLKRQAGEAFNATTESEKHRLWRQVFGEVLPLP